MMETESHVVKRGSCPECSSSDACMTYSDGHSWCYSCSTYFKSKDDSMSVQPQQQSTVRPMSVNGQITSIPDRKISEATCKKYNVRTIKDNSNKIIQHLYPYYDSDNNHVGDKVRNLPKIYVLLGMSDRVHSLDRTYSIRAVSTLPSVRVN